MNRKTASLAYPSNPLAAMRDLQDLDAVQKPVPHATSSAESSEVAQLPGSERSRVDSGADSSANAQAVAQMPTPKQSRVDSGVDSGANTQTVTQKPTPKRSSQASASDSAPEGASTNAMADAVWTMLQKPYTAVSRKGPFTVSTVKIPTEVWERLGWVSTLTNRAKQEIITDALKTHFEKVLKTWK